MHRSIARLLVLVMLVSAFGPLAMARDSQPMGPHCPRPAARPVMECHRGMTMAPPSSSDTSLGADHRCCLNHDCCCRMGTHQWARSQAPHLSEQAGLTQAMRVIACDQFIAFTPSDSVSARAPPAPKS